MDQFSLDLLKMHQTKQENYKTTSLKLPFFWFKFKYTSKILPKLHNTSKDGKTRQSCQCLPFSQPLQLTAVLTSDGRRPLQRSSKQLARLNIQWDTWPRQGRQRGCSEHRAIVSFAGREMVDIGGWWIFYFWGTGNPKQFCCSSFSLEG